MNINQSIGVQLEMKAWASPGPDQTLEQLVERMHELGNKVLEIDEPGNRVLICDSKDD
jgi:hypothetical protein